MCVHVCVCACARVCVHVVCSVCACVLYPKVHCGQFWRSMVCPLVYLGHFIIGLLSTSFHRIIMQALYALI